MKRGTKIIVFFISFYSASNIIANPNSISTPLYCSDYSYSAIKRSQFNKNYHCGYKGSEWTLKEEEHYEKCINRKKNINNEKVTKRYNSLNECIIKKQKNNFIIDKKNKVFTYEKIPIIDDFNKYYLPIINRKIDISNFFEKYKENSPCHYFYMDISLNEELLKITLYHNYSIYNMSNYGFLCFSSPNIYHTHILKFKKNDKWCLDTYININENTDMYNEGIYDGNKDVYKLNEGIKYSTSEIRGDNAHSNEPSDSKVEYKTEFKKIKECLSLDKSFELIFKDQLLE